MSLTPITPPGDCRSLLGIDLSGDADDPLASEARSSLASRAISLMVGAIAMVTGAALIGAGLDGVLGSAMIVTGLLRFLSLYLARSYPNVAFVINNLTGTLLVVLGLVEVGGAAGLEAWAVLIAGVGPLLRRPRQGRLFPVIYGSGIVIVAAAEIAARFLPPRVALSAGELSGWRLANLAAAAVVLATLTWIYRRTLDRAEARVADEQKVADRLLANILPGPIAQRLKREEYPIADAHEAVTVMFADGVNFSEFAANNSPQRVVELLNRIVYAFDDMVERRGVEKIKTIGDAYMVADGMTGGRADGATAVAELAFEMLDSVRAAGQAEGLPIDLRIGIHTGPVVAGVIGKHKFSYDVWGDTVNIAARLQSASEPGRIHISEATALALGPGWRVEPRGPIALKGTATLPTYFLLGRAGAIAAAAK